jgi:hypothetical protein
MENLAVSGSAIYFFIAVVLWTIPWKGVALWRAAKNGQKIWFVLMLILNTLGILEIIYIFIFSKKKVETEQTNQI